MEVEEGLSGEKILSGEERVFGISGGDTTSGVFAGVMIVGV